MDCIWQILVKCTLFTCVPFHCNFTVYICSVSEQWKLQPSALRSTNEIKISNLVCFPVIGWKTDKKSKFPSYWHTTVHRKAKRKLNGLGFRKLRRIEKLFMNDWVCQDFCLLTRTSCIGNEIMTQQKKLHIRKVAS